MLSRVVALVVADMIILAARKSQTNTVGVKMMRTMSSLPVRVTLPPFLLGSSGWSATLFVLQNLEAYAPQESEYTANHSGDNLYRLHPRTDPDSKDRERSAAQDSSQYLRT